MVFVVLTGALCWWFTWTSSPPLVQACAGDRAQPGTGQPAESPPLVRNAPDHLDIVVDREAAAAPATESQDGVRFPPDPRLRRAGAKDLKKALRLATAERDSFAKSVVELEGADDGSPTAYWAFLDMEMRREVREQAVQALMARHGYFLATRSREDTEQEPVLFGGQPYIGYAPFDQGTLYVPMTNPDRILELRRAWNELRLSILDDWAEQVNQRPIELRRQWRDEWQRTGTPPGWQQDLYSASAHNCVWDDVDARIRIRRFS